jgi:hypothetical protein
MQELHECKKSKCAKMKRRKDAKNAKTKKRGMAATAVIPHFFFI